MELLDLIVKYKDRSWNRSRCWALWVALALGFAMELSTGADAEDVTSQRVSTSLYGKAGLVEMPNALFFDTGHLSVTGMLKDPDDRITLNFQPLPWFEGSFRYSIIDGFFPARRGQDDLFDRSFDFKMKVLDQGTWWPAVAVGIQDIVGTGIYSSEFVVATWQTSKFNLTGGVGFGRFARTGNLTNPLTFIFDEAKTRKGFASDTGNRGGLISTGQFFRGEDMGLFGGIEYLTPIEGLKLKAEYSSDTYLVEEFRGIADADFPLNFEISYRYGDNMEFGASLVHGNVFAMRFTMQMNPISQRDPPRLDAPRFRFRSREEDPAPDVKPFAGGDELYRQYAALRKKQARSEDQQESRDYLSPDNVWNPWERTNRHERKRGTRESEDRREISVPRTVDFNWVELVQDYSTVQENDLRSLVGYPPTDWRLATWSDEVIDSPQPDHPPSLSRDLIQAQYSAPTADDRAALARALAKTWSWPLTDDDKALVANSIREASSVQGIAAVAVDFDDTKLTLYYYNGKYNREAEAIGRLLAILTQAAPDRIEQFRLIAVINDLQVSQVTVPRRSLERIIANYGSPQELFNVATFKEGPRSRQRNLPLSKGWLPTISYGLSPSLRYSLFDPDDPMRYQMSALLSGVVELYDGLSISGLYRLNLYDNFDEITRGSNSVLPHVRSDFARYLKESENSMETLSLSYAWQPARGFYARTFGGYLEEMYAGVGGEVLYRPYGKRWALALEVDYVRQRNFDRGFGLQDYETVTGFAKAYYEVPYQNLQLELNVGRYLAEDIGATLKISRKFNNGTEIGAFATLTDVPFNEFGEGSFDKGIIVKIPFHLFSFFDTKQIYSTVIRPLTRDGGAQVWSGTPLYDVTQQFSLGNIRRNWEAVFE